MRPFSLIVLASLLLTCGPPQQQERTKRLYEPCVRGTDCMDLLCVAGICTHSCTATAPGVAVGACVSASECQDSVVGCCRITDNSQAYGVGTCVTTP